MRKRSAGAVLVVAALVLAVSLVPAAMAADGDLDTSFGTYGKVRTSIDSGAEAYSVAIQSDGKIVAAGYSYTGSRHDFALARYNANGSLDTSFDTDGKVTTPIGPEGGEAYSVAIQSDGKIVAAGTSLDEDGYPSFGLARYNTNGTLDTTFGTDGKVTTPIGYDRDRAYSVAIQSDGKIVAAGYSDNGSNSDFALARYNANGSLDTSFDTDGKVTTPIGFWADASSVAIQSDGKIVAAGDSAIASTRDFALARYNANGSLDTSFDTDGKVTTPISSSGFGWDEAQSVAIQSDGKIVAAGWSNDDSNADFALARYNTDGSLDTSFGSGGKLTTPMGSGEDALYSIAIQSDGKIVAAGTSDFSFALVRYGGPYGGPPPTSLSIKAPSKVAAGSKAKITGVLFSVDASCTSTQQVTLKKGTATVGTANTSATGAYKFTLKIKKKTTVQVIYAGSSTCGASASPKKTIKVT